MNDALEPVMATESSSVAAAEPEAMEALADVVAPRPRDRGDIALLAIIDRLAGLLDRSDLIELEVEAGGTGVVLRKPAALASTVTIGSAPGIAPPTDGPLLAGGSAQAPVRDGAAPDRPSVRAPLTGIFYASPAPGSAPYVQVGGEVAVGQVIGLIEAMKLFNEIKSDLAGRVVRVVPESGTLVKAKQPLIEVEPL
jgi:acetyl-CoA carboxylase biotin carboxyl carrier protein